MALSRLLGGFMGVAVGATGFYPTSAPQSAVELAAELEEQKTFNMFEAAGVRAHLRDASLAEALAEAEARYGLSKQLILAVALVESGLQPRACSPVGARGLMQVMPDTARAIWGNFVATLPADDALRQLKVPQIQDLQQVRLSVLLGSYYLADLLRRFGGNLNLALAAYNYGPYRVERIIKQSPQQQPMRMVAHGYVTRVHDNMRVLSRIAAR